MSRLLGAQLFMTGLLGEMLIRGRMEETAAYDVREALEPAEAPQRVRRGAPVAPEV